MFNLTRLEQQAILFVTCSLLVGGAVTLVRSYQQDSTVVGGFGTTSGDPVAVSDTTTIKDASQARTALIDLNTASAKQLQTLPGIGPRLSERIIAYRTQHGIFKTTDQLLEVKGIGPTLLSRLKPLISVP